jgi:hypothetical protein
MARREEMNLQKVKGSQTNGKQEIVEKAVKKGAAPVTSSWATEAKVPFQLICSHFWSLAEIEGGM